MRRVEEIYQLDPDGWAEKVCPGLGVLAENDLRAYCLDRSVTKLKLKLVFDIRDRFYLMEKHGWDEDKKIRILRRTLEYIEKKEKELEP